MIRQTLWALMAAVTAAALTPAPDADAATFRVTSRIYEGDNLNASSEHWILFDNGLIYDLPRIDDRFVTVFDPAQKRVTLLDRQGRVQTRLNTDDLLGAAAQVRADAATEQQKARIGVDAKVEPSRRVIGYSIRFADFEYHATTQQPDDPDVAADYGRFTLLASQLNIVRHLGPPPFARMTLVQYMAARGELPLECTLLVGQGENTQRYRSTFAVAELSETDRKKIDGIRSMLALYREVPLKEFP